MGQGERLDQKLDRLLFQQLGQLNLPLLIDDPLGMAPEHPVQGRLVITTNQTHEYLLDIQERQPRAFLVRPFITDAEGLVSSLPLKPEQLLYVGPPLYSPLTPGERRILRLLAHQNSDKRIASLLGRSPRTVSNQVSTVLHKLGQKSRYSATEYYWGRNVKSNLTHSYRVLLIMRGINYLK